MSKDAFDPDIPFDPTNTNWKVYVLENDVLAKDPSDTWNFKANNEMDDTRNVWTGTWGRTQNDRVNTTSEKVGNGTIIFLNEGRFIALNANYEVIRYGIRIF